MSATHSLDVVRESGMIHSDPSTGTFSLCLCVKGVAAESLCHEHVLGNWCRILRVLAANPELVRAATDACLSHTAG